MSPQQSYFLYAILSLEKTPPLGLVAVNIFYSIEGCYYGRNYCGETPKYASHNPFGRWRTQSGRSYPLLCCQDNLGNN